MALKKTVVFRGLQVADAYITIETTTILSGNQDMELRIGYWLPDQSTQFHAEKFLSTYELSGDNPIAQGYEYIKTLPEFEGCVDC